MSPLGVIEDAGLQVGSFRPLSTATGELPTTGGDLIDIRRRKH
jgi:hypothetical protein